MESKNRCGDDAMKKMRNNGMMKKLPIILFALLLLVGTVSADDESTSSGGFLEVITDWVWGIFSGGDESLEDSGEPTYEGGFIEILTNGTDMITAPTENLSNVTTTSTSPAPVIGTVYAVDYKTSPPYGSAPLMIRFTANTSTSENILWDYGDGHHSTEYDNFHSYLAAGNYVATLTLGNITASVNILVEPPGVVHIPENEEMLF